MVLNYLKKVSKRAKQGGISRCVCMNSFSVFFVAVLLSIFPARSLFAQKPALVPAPTPAAVDSTKQGRSAADTIPETVKRNGIRVGTGPSTSRGPSSRPVLAPDDALSLDKPDTVRVTAKQEAQIHKIIPRQATIRSLMLPGLGQAYNRQYYKIPFIYAGFGVMGYLFVKYRGLAKEAEDGYRRLLYGDKIVDTDYINLNPTLYPASLTNPMLTPSVTPEYVLISGFQVRSTATAKNAYDTYRRYRDLNILLSAVLWGVNIIEANVAAHLKTFDLTDDISMRVEPSVLPMPGTGMVPGVRVAFTFK